MSVTPREQCTFLGNGIGQVYITDSSGTLGNDPYAPSRGIENGILAKNRAIAIGMGARKRAVNTRATAYVTITLAAADNLAVFTIGGVSQITAPVAMTPADEAASAASIVAAINSTVTTPNWTATQNGTTIMLQCQTTGAAGNNLAIVLTFSGASTATYPALTGGGNDSSEYATRIFLDTDPLASPTAIGANAIEITSALASNSPNPPTDVAVVASALTFDRKDTVNNIAATGGGTISNIFMADVQEGDVITVYAKAGEPALTLYNPTGTGNLSLIVSTPFISSGAVQSITLQWRLLGGSTYKWMEISPRIAPTPTDLRAYGSQVPLVAGALAIPTLLGGGITPFTPGGADNYNAYLTGSGVLGGGGFSVPLVAGADIEDGDNGTIYGNGIALTGDPLTVAGFIVPAALKATGLWSIDWRRVAGGFIIMPSWDLVNTPDWITTSMIAPAAVTNTELATGIDGAKLLPESVGLGQVSDQIQAMLAGSGEKYADVVIASADVLTLNTTPITIVPAPGSGFALVLSKWTCNMIFNTTAYATNTGLVVRNPSVAAVYDQGINPFFLTSAPAPGTPVWTMCSIRENVTNTQIVENQPLEVAILVGNATAGDSDIQVRIWYRIIAV